MKNSKPPASIMKTPIGVGNSSYMYTGLLLDLVEKRLNSDSPWTAYITPEQLARATKANPGVALSPEIHSYLCDFLEGKIKKPSGRPPDSESASKTIKNIFIQIVHDHYYIWLKERNNTIGLKGGSLFNNADWWQGPPNERAARITCRALRLSINWRSVLNIISKSK